MSFALYVPLSQRQSIPMLQGEMISLGELCGNRIHEPEERTQYTCMKFRPYLTRRQILMREHFKCEWCGTSSTPEMRRGPSGKNSLCNRCGLKFHRDEKHKEVRKAAESSGNKMSISYLTEGDPDSAIKHACAPA